MKQFYVYELIDPKTHLPFYIGKGTGKRMYYHFNRVQNNSSLNNKHLENKLRQLIKENLKPEHRKILETEDQQLAFDKEKERIKELGRENLCNLTDGGEGPFNCIRSSETKEKIRQKNIANNKNPEYRKMISEKTKIAMNRPDVRNKILKICSSLEFREKVSRTTREAMNRPEVKQKMINAQTGKNNGFHGHLHSNKWRENHSKCVSGKNNPMYGKSLFDVWTEKYGIDEAYKRQETWKTRLKLAKST